VKHSLYKSFGFAAKGILLSLKERNKKIQVFCALVCIALGFYFQISTVEWCIILLCITLVLVLEMLNTVIERIVDVVSPAYNEKAGQIKDIAAGAVLVASVLASVIGIIIFWKYFVDLFTH
jgi:diacylglycerol kinase (ATP)